MSQTPFSNKVEILGQFWLFYRQQTKEDSGWVEFFRWADIGMPMAYMAWQELVTIKPSSKQYVNDVWDMFCDILSVDANARYGSLEEVFDASPNAEIDAEG